MLLLALLLFANVLLGAVLELLIVDAKTIRDHLLVKSDFVLVLVVGLVRKTQTRREEPRSSSSRVLHSISIDVELKEGGEASAVGPGECLGEPFLPSSGGGVGRGLSRGG